MTESHAFSVRVLVTGGAGFIGRHLVDALVGAGHEVVILDNLDARIHPSKPEDLNPHATYIWKDIRDREAVREAGKGRKPSTTWRASSRSRSRNATSDGTLT